MKSRKAKREKWRGRRSFAKITFRYAPPNCHTLSRLNCKTEPYMWSPIFTIHSTFSVSPLNDPTTLLVCSNELLDPLLNDPVADTVRWHKFAQLRDNVFLGNRINQLGFRVIMIIKPLIHEAVDRSWEQVNRSCFPLSLKFSWRNWHLLFLSKFFACLSRCAYLTNGRNADKGSAPRT